MRDLQMKEGINNYLVQCKAYDEFAYITEKYELVNAYDIEGCNVFYFSKPEKLEVVEKILEMCYSCNFSGTLLLESGVPVKEINVDAFDKDVYTKRTKLYTEGVETDILEQVYSKDNDVLLMQERFDLIARESTIDFE